MECHIFDLAVKNRQLIVFLYSFLVFVGRRGGFARAKFLTTKCHVRNAEAIFRSHKQAGTDLHGSLWMRVIVSTDNCIGCVIAPVIHSYARKVDQSKARFTRSANRRWSRGSRRAKRDRVLHTMPPPQGWLALPSSSFHCN